MPSQGSYLLLPGYKPLCAPAIRMDPADHILTASHGSRPGSPAYRSTQRALVVAGDYRGAFEMDVADIRDNVPGGANRYGAAIEQARASIPYTSGVDGGFQCGFPGIGVDGGVGG